MEYKMDFEPPRWFVCDHSLRVLDESEWLQAPADWPSLGVGSDARKAQEEVLETILILNLRRLLREQVTYLCRAGDTWGREDITGVDNLGRFHLFELKRDYVSEDVPEQLGAYLLSRLFKAGDDFLDESWQLNNGVSAERWALFLAAAHANERTSNIGRRFVNESHPGIRSGFEPVQRVRLAAALP